MEDEIMVLAAMPPNPVRIPIDFSYIIRRCCKMFQSFMGTPLFFRVADYLLRPLLFGRKVVLKMTSGS
jgi:hypothetical protein